MEWGPVSNRTVGEPRAELTPVGHEGVACLNFKCVCHMGRVAACAPFGGFSPGRSSLDLFAGVEEACPILKLYEYFKLAFQASVQRTALAGLGELRET